MNREEAIKHLETYSTTNGSGQTTQAQHEEAKQMAIKALEQEPKYCDRNICIKNEYNGISCDECEVTKSQEPKTGHWIPVSERLPEESLNSVIGWDAYRERCVFVQYIDGYFQITGSAESFDIVAWMPLPEPYEPQERSDKE